MKAINILWSVDSEDELEMLPDEIEIPNEVIADAEDDDDYQEAISDYISDVTGYCHCGFELDDEQS